MEQTELVDLIRLKLPTNRKRAIYAVAEREVLEAIVAEIFARLSGDGISYDDRSIDLDANRALRLKKPTWVPVSGSKKANCIDFNTTSDALSGVYVKVDGKTIFANGSGELTTVSQNVTPDVVVSSNDFTTQPGGVTLVNAYLSTGSKNGYLKLDTGATETSASMLVYDTPVSHKDNPSVTLPLKLSSITELIAYIRLTEIIGGSASGAMMYFIFDPTVSANWLAVITDGGEYTETIDTLVPADTSEHIFGIAADESGLVTWEIDGEEVATCSVINLTTSQLYLMVEITSTESAVKKAEIDYYSLRADRVSETSVTYNTAAAISAPKKHIGFWSQAGANAPTVSELVNTLGALTLARTSVGTYTITKTGAFVSGKTVPLDDIWTDASGNTYTLVRTSADVLTLTTKDSTGALADGILSSRYISIEVYQ